MQAHEALGDLGGSGCVARRRWLAGSGPLPPRQWRASKFFVESYGRTEAFRLNCSVLAQLVCCSSFGRGRRRLRELYRARFPLRHDRGRGKGGSGGHALLGGGLVFGSRAEHQAWSTCSFRLKIFRLTRRPQFLANARHNQSMRYQTHIAQESRGRITEKLIRSFSIGVRSIGRDDATRVSRMLAAAIEAHFSTCSCFCEKGSLSDGSSLFGSSFCEG